MYCKHCGKKISDDAVFCQHCGEQQKDNTTLINTNLLESNDTTIEDKIRKVLKFVFKKLLQLIGITAIAFVAAFLMYHIFMQINKPYKNKEEAYELYNKHSSNIKYYNNSFAPSSDYGTYKYDNELSNREDFEQIEIARWYRCEVHAETWSIWTFVIVEVGLLCFFFFKWLFQHNKQMNNNDMLQKSDDII